MPNLIVPSRAGWVFWRHLKRYQLFIFVVVYHYKLRRALSLVFRFFVSDFTKEINLKKKNKTIKVEFNFVVSCVQFSFF